MATFYLIINQRLMFEVLKDGMWGCSSLLVCRVQNHAVQINEMKSGICRWRSNYEIFSRHIKPRLHVLLEPVSHWSSPNACVDAHHHPYLLLFLDVDGKKFAPVVIHVMTLLRLCHSDIFLPWARDTLPPLRGRGGSLVISLSKMVVINLPSHSPKVTAVIYKGSWGQSSTRSLILLIIQRLLFPPLVLKLVHVPRWRQPLSPSWGLFC